MLPAAASEVRGVPAGEGADPEAERGAHQEAQHQQALRHPDSESQGSKGKERIIRGIAIGKFGNRKRVIGINLGSLGSK